jgi:hypothetical protein
MWRFSAARARAEVTASLLRKRSVRVRGRWNSEELLSSSVRVVQRMHDSKQLSITRCSPPFFSRYTSWQDAQASARPAFSTTRRPSPTGSIMFRINPAMGHR